MARAGRLAALVVAGVAVAVLGWWLLREPVRSGPAPVPWNRVACARCGMLVGEPGFAAQIQGRNGELLHFDDPGCLLLHEAAPHPPRHAVWVHHHAEDRWLRLEEAGFVAAPGPTPMGYGLAAVARATSPGALGPEAALRQTRARDAARAGDPS